MGTDSVTSLLREIELLRAAVTQSSARRYYLLSQGLCPWCLQPSEGVCARTRCKKLEAESRKLVARVLEGLCPRCGDPSRSDCTLCESCSVVQTIKTGRVPRARVLRAPEHRSKRTGTCLRCWHKGHYAKTCVTDPADFLEARERPSKTRSRTTSS